MRKIFGIDISSFQGDFNFEAAKDDKVKFIMLRAGFTDADNGKTKTIDPRFEEYYKEAKDKKIAVGAYWYSRAITYEEGKEEALFMYENCLRTKQFEYPIAIDVEDNLYQRKAGKTAVTEAIKGFCEYLEDKGYYVIIYASVNWFRNYIETEALTKYDKWVADWNRRRPKYPVGGMWQFAGGKSRPIAGVDCDKDYAYKDYPQIMINRDLNGFRKEEIYYPKTEYKGNSFVDGLKSINVDSSYQNREKIAIANDIHNYRGTSKQNTQLLNLLKKGLLKK